MIYIKRMKNNEKLKMQAVEMLPCAKEIMLPHVMLGDLCIMPMAKSLTRYQHADPVKMMELLRVWYQRTTNSYSEGIYSFARKGRTQKAPEQPYYAYLKQEIDALTAQSSIKGEYAELEKVARTMWNMSYEQYKDTFFGTYNLLHGDLHTGNIVAFMGRYRLIDWENFRSGPKEIELSFYLCWDYLCSGERNRSLQEIPEELNIFLDGKLITQQERDRILFCLIPMWMLLIILYLNNGNLLFEEERRKVCSYIIPLYKKTIFDNSTRGETTSSV